MRRPQPPPAVPALGLRRAPAAVNVGHIAQVGLQVAKALELRVDLLLQGLLPLRRRLHGQAMPGLHFRGFRAKCGLGLGQFPSRRTQLRRKARRLVPRRRLGLLQRAAHVGDVAPPCGGRCQGLVPACRRGRALPLDAFQPRLAVLERRLLRLVGALHLAVLQLPFRGALQRVHCPRQLGTGARVPAAFLHQLRLQPRDAHFGRRPSDAVGRAVLLEVVLGRRRRLRRPGQLLVVGGEAVEGLLEGQRLFLGPLERQLQRRQGRRLGRELLLQPARLVPHGARLRERRTDPAVQQFHLLGAGQRRRRHRLLDDLELFLQRLDGPVARRQLGPSIRRVAHHLAPQLQELQRPLVELLLELHHAVGVHRGPAILAIFIPLPGPRRQGPLLRQERRMLGRQNKRTGRLLII